MFNENFSFGGSREALPPLHIDDRSPADISPFNSRCPSPRLYESSRKPSLSHRDSRFDTYRPPRHPSVTALTAQLEHHVISELSRPESPVSMTSPESIMDHDEGFYDGPDTPSTNYSDDSDFDPILWDLSQMGATSSPRPSLSLEAQAMSSYTQRRRQRQALVRLQCLVKRTPDLAMLIEECHPSSLPLTGETFCSQSRSNSTVSLGVTSNPTRVEKTPPTAVRKPVKMRKRAIR